MIGRLMTVAGVVILCACPILAQDDMPPPDHPVVILGPPEGFEPPGPPPAMPEDPMQAEQIMLDMFFDFMAGQDGVVDRDEFKAWIHQFHMPPPMHHDGDPMGPPPHCDTNGDGMVDEFEAEQCGPPPHCDTNGDGMVDETEAEQCGPPPECDFNGDGMIDATEADQCAEQHAPPGG